MCELIQALRRGDQLIELGSKRVPPSRQRDQLYAHKEVRMDILNHRRRSLGTCIARLHGYARVA